MYTDISIHIYVLWEMFNLWLLLLNVPSDQHCAPRKSPDGWFAFHNQAFQHQHFPTKIGGVMPKRK